MAGGVWPHPTHLKHASLNSVFQTIFRWHDTQLWASPHVVTPFAQSVAPGMMLLDLLLKIQSSFFAVLDIDIDFGLPCAVHLYTPTYSNCM